MILPKSPVEKWPQSSYGNRTRITMLKIYKNELLAVIERARFSRDDFIGEETEENGQKFFEVWLRNSPLKFRVLESAHSYESLNYQFVRMAPGFPWWGPFKSDGILETCNGFATWLDENVAIYVDEQSTLDLWSQLQSLAVLFEGKWKQQEELESFTEREKAEIRRAIRQVERQIAEGFTLTSEQAAVVHDRLDYLEAAIDRLNRFDWSSVLLTTVIGIVTTLSLDTERGKQLYGLILQAFSGLVRLLKP
jgi:hypothetical protein